ncbi:DUF2867 domain-containing protein [Nocardioides zeae]|uniref:DUF2867 domain-containing protein n=1 Tax=Nocardioides imazamoxiresistens TaxID=3231893 RepID=A0ABU3PYS5_9ACTN|nr:DUF2867 domain-containing protein [Nocardioides zeae]MDT9594408.1 DUF2867 domain-containing protein [Nocardioides zeae]
MRRTPVARAPWGRALPRPTRSRRTVEVAADPEVVTAVLAAAPAGAEPRWYRDAVPLRFRAVLDGWVSQVLGPPAGAAPSARPDGPRERLREATADDAFLAAGDRAGFWEVDDSATTATPPGHRLVLRAVVHAPGEVLLRAVVAGVAHGPGAGPRTRVTLDVELHPRGLLGALYLAADLPAREVVVEGVAHALVADLRRAGLTPTPPPAAGR